MMDIEVGMVVTDRLNWRHQSRVTEIDTDRKAVWTEDTHTGMRGRASIPTFWKRWK